LAVAEEPVLDDEVFADDVVPPLEWVVVVRPLRVVDEDTFPPPAVTEEDKPLFVVVSPSMPSMTVQVVPSSNVTCSDEAATAMVPTRMSGSASGCLSNVCIYLISLSSKGLVPE
jgi:hypothetical protein